jgi:cytochrome bd-type quinol oxidase subunit 1
VSDLDIFVSLAITVIAIGLVITFTVSAILAVRRGERFWKTLETWFTRLFDIVFGLG